MTSIPRSQISPHDLLVEDRVINLNEAAVRLGCSVATLRRCSRRGELRILKLSPRRVGVRLSDLAAYLNSRAA